MVRRMRCATLTRTETSLRSSATADRSMSAFLRYVLSTLARPPWRRRQAAHRASHAITKLGLDARPEKEQDPRVRIRARATWVIGAAMLVGLTACADGPAGHDGFVTVAGDQLDVWCDGGRGPTVIFVS